MELRQYLSVLRSRFWLIIAATLLAGGAGFFLSSSTPSYLARSTLYVGSQNVTAEETELNTDRLAALQSFILTFSKMIDSEPVATQALRELDLEVDLEAEDVVDATDVELEPGTQLLYIDVSDEDGATAQSLSNALADAFVELVQEFEPGEVAEGSVPRLPAYVFERAQLPTDPEPTGQLRTVILSIVFGLVGGIALAFLLDYLDVSLRSAADVERRLELPVLGVIPALGSEAPFGGRARAHQPTDRAGARR